MIKTSQISKLILFVIPATKLLLLPSILTNYVGRDAWLFMLFAFIADIAILSLIIATCKKQEGRKISDMFPHKSIGIAVCIILAVFLLLKAFYPIIEHKLFLEDSLYIKFPKYAIFVPIIVLIGYFAMKKLSIFGRMADLFFIPVLGSLTLMIALSAFSGDYSELLPIAYNGLEPFGRGVAALFFFGDFIFIYAFFGKINSDGGFSWLIKAAIAVALLCTVFCAIYTSIFGGEAYSRIFALSKISKFNPLVNNLGRMDWIAILIMLCGIITYSALFIACAGKLLVQAYKKIRQKYAVITISAIFFVLIILAVSSFDGMTKLYSNIFIYYMIFCQYFLPILIFILVRNKEPLPYKNVNLGNTPQGLNYAKK